jgi:two-component system, response regulator YesN
VLFYALQYMATIGQTKSDDAPSTIFVVDDEPILLELAAAVLQPAGFNVRTFRDPKTALKEFSAASPRPAIVVTDYAMGPMNGLDFIRECRRIQPQQKILLLSGTVDESIYANATVKPDRFLAKPYQSHDLIALVQSLVAA